MGRLAQCGTGRGSNLGSWAALMAIAIAFGCGSDGKPAKKADGIETGALHDQLYPSRWCKRRGCPAKPEK
jgi:hypothetical protein